MLEWTGERFLPWLKESVIAYEHLHRYAYASTFVRDKTVLDLASGEGYGSKILSECAASVVGVDIDELAVEHAAKKYAGGNLRFISGSITDVPIPGNHAFDVIVCFEAIEHIEDHQKLLSEVKRLLKPGGTFIVSTPNKAVYRDESEQHNPFHAKELYFEEFHELLGGYFKNVSFLGQRVHPASSIWPMDGSNGSAFQEFTIARGDPDFELKPPDKEVPLYFIAVASDAGLAPPSGSVMIDRSDSLIEEKNRTIRWLEEQVAAGESAHEIASLKEGIAWREGQVRELSEQIASLEDAVIWQQGQIRDLTDHIALLEQSLKSREPQLVELSRELDWSREHTAELEKTIASRDETLAAFTRQAAELERVNTSLAAGLENAQGQLNVINASRGWRLLTRLRKIRDSFKGLAKFRE